MGENLPKVSPRIRMASGVQADLAGHLLKLSDHRKVWNRRYLRLEGRRLLVFERERDSKPKYIMQLEGATTRWIGTKQQSKQSMRHVFSLHLPAQRHSKAKTYKLASEDQTAAEAWSQALNIADKHNDQPSQQLENSEAVYAAERLGKTAQRIFDESKSDAPGWTLETATKDGVRVWTKAATPKQGAASGQQALTSVLLPAGVVCGVSWLLLNSVLGVSGFGVVSTLAALCVGVLVHTSHNGECVLPDAKPHLSLGAAAGVLLFFCVLAPAFVSLPIVSCLLAIAASPLFQTSLRRPVVESKAIFRIAFSPEIVLRMITSVSRRPEWDPCLESAELLSSSRNQSTVRLRYKSSVPDFFEDRELVLSQSWQSLGRRSFVVVEQSVDDKIGRQQSSSCVRARLAHGGIVIVPCNDLGTHSVVTVVSALDIGEPSHRLSAVVDIASRVLCVKSPSALFGIDGFLRTESERMVEAIRAEPVGGAKHDDQADETDGVDPDAALKEKYLAMVNSKRDLFLEMALGGEEDGWIFVQDKDDVVVRKKLIEGFSLPATRGEGRIPVSPEIMMALLWDVVCKSEWDDMFDGGDDVFVVDAQTKIIHQRFKSMWPTKARDMLNLVKFERQADGSFVTVAVSCLYDDCPPLKTHVRAECIVGGWLLQPVAGDANAVDIIYAQQSDLKGNIPKSLLKIIAMVQPMVIAGIRKYLAGLNGDYSRFDMSCIEQCDDAELANDAPPTSASSDDVDDRQDTSGNESEALPVSAAPRASTPTKSLVSPATPTKPLDSSVSVRADSPAALSVSSGRKLSLGSEVAPSEAPTDFVQPTTRIPKYAELAAEAVRDTLASEQHPEWQPLCSKDGVEIFTRDIGQNAADIPCVKGCGRVEQPVAVVAELVWNIYRKKRWDAMFDFGDQIAIDEHTIIGLEVYKKQWPTTARDFLLAVQWQKLPGGGIVIGAKSVEHASFPIHKKRVRGHLFHGGYVIRPVEGQEDKACSVAYVCHMDLKGSIPKSILKKVVQQDQPLLVASIAACLKDVDPTTVDVSLFCGETEPSALPTVLKQLLIGDGKGNSYKPALARAQGLVLGASDDCGDFSDGLDTDRNGWQFVHTKHDVTVHTRDNFIRGVAVLDFAAEQVLAMTLDVERKKIWDKMLETANVVRIVDAHTCVQHQRFKAVWPTSAREFLTAVHWVRLPDQRFVSCAVSINDDDLVARKRNVVRAECECGGFVITPIDKSRCRVVYVISSDLKGSLPKSIARKAALDQPLNIATIRDQMDQMDRSTIDTQQFDVPDQAPLANASTSSDAGAAAVSTTASPLSPSQPAQKPSSSDDSDDDSATSSPFLEMADEALGQLIEMSVDQDQWTVISEKDNVRVFSCAVLSSSGGGVDKSREIFMAEGVVEASPVDILNLTLDTDRRAWFDSQYVRGDDVEPIDSNTKIAYQVLCCKGVFKRILRDFCVLSHWRKLEDGAAVVVTKSIQHEQCPVGADLNRGQINLGGWIIRPSKKSNNRSLVTYIMDVSLSGEGSRACLDSFRKKQPQTISRMRKLFLN